MAESHRSLRDDYRELDLLVDLAMQQEGVLGARTYLAGSDRGRKAPLTLTGT
jgi:galactokinase